MESQQDAQLSQLLNRQQSGTLTEGDRARLVSYDVVNMPPVSLIQNVQMRGQCYQSDGIQNLKIPVRMEYRFRNYLLPKTFATLFTFSRLYRH